MSGTHFPLFLLASFLRNLRQLSVPACTHQTG
jgi:hypothetical protein